jgi:hypothetical protein
MIIETHIEFGMNTIVVPYDVEDILSHPRNKQRAALFEPIKDWKCEQG